MYYLFTYANGDREIERRIEGKQYAWTGTQWVPTTSPSTFIATVPDTTARLMGATI